MPIDFPNTPATNATYTVGGRTWVYDGEKWTLRTGTVLPLYTASTRPTATEGLLIYETDTDRVMVYNGSAWKITGGVMPAVSITSTTNQTGIVNNTWTKLSLASHTSAVNNGSFTISAGAITIPTGCSGLYAIYGQVQWDTNATGYRTIQLASASNLGTPIITASSAAAAVYVRTAISGSAYLTAGTSYCLSVLQDSGADRATETTFMNTTFTLAMINQY